MWFLPLFPLFFFIFFGVTCVQWILNRFFFLLIDHLLIFNWRHWMRLIQKFAALIKLKCIAILCNLFLVNDKFLSLSWNGHLSFECNDFLCFCALCDNLFGETIGIERLQIKMLLVHWIMAHEVEKNLLTMFVR